MNSLTFVNKFFHYVNSAMIMLSEYQRPAQITQLPKEDVNPKENVNLLLSNGIMNRSDKNLRHRKRRYCLLQDRATSNRVDLKKWPSLHDAEKKSGSSNRDSIAGLSAANGRFGRALVCFANDCNKVFKIVF
jgi:hypothetical protein